MLLVTATLHVTVVGLGLYTGLHTVNQMHATSHYRRLCVKRSHTALFHKSPTLIMHANQMQQRRVPGGRGEEGRGEWEADARRQRTVRRHAGWSIDFQIVLYLDIRGWSNDW